MDSLTSVHRALLPRASVSHLTGFVDDADSENRKVLQRMVQQTLRHSLSSCQPSFQWDFSPQPALASFCSSVLDSDAIMHLEPISALFALSKSKPVSGCYLMLTPAFSENDRQTCPVDYSAGSRRSTRFPIATFSTTNLSTVSFYSDILRYQSLCASSAV